MRFCIYAIPSVPDVIYGQSFNKGLIIIPEYWIVPYGEQTEHFYLILMQMQRKMDEWKR